MADLRTDYKDDILDTSVNTQRKYRMVTNDDGTVSFVDVTVYTQNGDTFGASEVNKIHAAVNLVNKSLNVRYNEDDDTLEILHSSGEWVVIQTNVYAKTQGTIFNVDYNPFSFAAYESSGAVVGTSSIMLSEAYDSVCNTLPISLGSFTTINLVTSQHGTVSYPLASFNNIANLDISGEIYVRVSLTTTLALGIWLENVYGASSGINLGSSKTGAVAITKIYLS